MSGDAVFRNLVHLARADLQFDTLMARAHNRRVDRLVVVLLRSRDVVLETAGHRAPRRMHETKHPVTIVNRVNDQAKGINVGQLFEADLPVLHLTPDRVGLLLTPRNFRRDARFREFGGQCRADVFDQPFVLGPQFCEFAGHSAKGFGM